MSTKDLNDELFLGVTLRVAADYLGVTPDNLRGAIKRGTLKARKVGRDWFVNAADVEKYRNEHLRKQSRG